MPAAPTRTLVRGIRIIETLSEHHEGMRLTDLADAVDLDKATVTRLLGTLESVGYVAKDDGGPIFRLTAKILHLAEGVAAQLDIRYLARPHLRRLCAEVGEIVHLGVLEGEHIVYIEKLEPPDQKFRLVTAVGQTMPINSTALGKAIVSRMTPPDRDRLVQGLKWEQRTPNTITSPKAFKAAVESALRSGYAVDDEENLEGAMCVAAAVVGPDGRPVAAVSISSIRFRIESRIEDLGASVNVTATRISRELGGRSAAIAEAW